MENNSNITADTMEHFLEIVSDFEEYLNNEGYSQELINERINILHTLPRVSRSDYGLINYIITATSNWDETFKVFIKDFLYPLFINVYKSEIDKDAKKLLLLISNYMFTYGDTFLAEPFKMLREYARDIVLLNSTDPSGHYSPRFNDDEDISAIILSLKDAKSIPEILSNKSLGLRVQGYIDKVKQMKIKGGKEVMPKDIVPIFYSIAELGLIKMEYLRSFGTMEHLKEFISQLRIFVRELSNKDIYTWNPKHQLCSPNARAEVDLHKLNLEKVLS